MWQGGFDGALVEVVCVLDDDEATMRVLAIVALLLPFLVWCFICCVPFAFCRKQRPSITAAHGLQSRRRRTPPRPSTENDNVQIQTLPAEGASVKYVHPHVSHSFNSVLVSEFSLLPGLTTISLWPSSPNECPFANDDLQQ